MDFNLNKEQELIRKNARDFLSEYCQPSLVKEIEQSEEGYASELWAQMAEMGWLGLAIPERYGGTGGSFLDLMILLEENGRTLAPVPFFSTVILCSMLILEAGSESQKQNYLPLISDGKLIFSLPLTEEDVSWEPAAIKMQGVPNGNGYVCSGTKLFVYNANIADYFICPVRTAKTIEDGVSLFLIDRNSFGIEQVLLKNIAREKMYEVIFNHVEVPRENLIGKVNQGWAPLEKVLTKAALAKSIEMIGGMQRVLEMTVEYAKQRVQFGQKIGSFQAVQHHCANMLIAIEGSRLLAYRTAWMLQEGIPCQKEIHMTKAWTNDACQKVARLGVQVHGGLGIMDEYDMQLYFRRAKASESFLGNSDYHREKTALHMLL
jgi:alkylation response protein AidB-like acyl-CoA dehydrogenase